MTTRILPAAILLAALAAFSAETLEVQLQRAVQKEAATGDLKTSIEEYRKIADRAGPNHTVAAQALLHLAECYQKLGDGEARRVYERIVRELGDQTQAAATARARLGAGASAGTLVRRLLCTECGDEESNVSADGHWVASTEWEETGDLIIRDLSTGQTKRLMAKNGTFKESAAHVHLPFFSPDLRQVAYNWETDDNENGQLRVVANGPGAKARILLDRTSDHEYVEPAGWSPDGKSILAVISKNDGTAQLAWVTVPDAAVNIVKQLQFRLVQHDSDRSDVKLSPDGRFIAFAALASNPSKYPEGDPEDRHIYVLSADGSMETEVAKTAGTNRSPVWTPDGKHLTFISDRSGSPALWSVAIENGKPAGAPIMINSVPGDSRVWPLGVTRSGSYSYSASRDGLEQIFIEEIDSGGRKIQGRPPAEAMVGMRPAWSPDGKLIAFKRHHPSSPTAHDLVVHSMAAGDEKTFPTTLGDHDNASPEWFHDNRGILIKLAHNGMNTGAYRVDVESGEFKQVLPGSVVHNRVAPMWLSPDDKNVYLFRGGPLARDLATGAEKQILTVPQGGLMMHRLSPDGRTWVVWRNDVRAKKASLIIADVDGSNVREIYTPVYSAAFGSFGSGRYSNLAWTRDGHTILFVQPNGGNSRIMRIPAQGGTPEFTGIEVAGGIQSLDISPDGSRIAYSAAKPVQELWTIDNILSALK